YGYFGINVVSIAGDLSIIFEERYQRYKKMKKNHKIASFF
ncbi:unnamed protein product, partial [marine sediment metagenome]